jgi:hypothetical protein
MALSAACPIFRGYLVDVDCRWDVISGSVDDRTKEERSEKVSAVVKGIFFKKMISPKPLLDSKFLNPAMHQFRHTCLLVQIIQEAVEWGYFRIMSCL